jgi:hypothetical protein
MYHITRGKDVSGWGNGEPRDDRESDGDIEDVEASVLELLDNMTEFDPLGLHK